MRLLPALRAFAALAVLLSACSSGGTTDPDPVGSFTFALAENMLYPGDQTLWIQPGESQAVTVLITRIDGFSAAVTVTVTGLPAGVTQSALTIPAGATSGVLTLNAAANTALGVTTLTVRAAGGGAPERTFPLAITVDPASAPRGYAFTLTPNFLAIERSTARTTTIGIVPADYDRSVTLSATGLPTGVTASFAPTTITGGTTSVMTLTAAAGATLGSAVVVIRGTTPAVADVTTNLPIEVLVPGGPPPSGPNMVTWDFCAESGLPVWVAIQDALDPWTRITGTGDRYTFDVNFGRGGIAWVMPNGQGGFEVNVFYGTQAELKATGAARCNGNPGAGKSVSGTVAGFGGGTELALLRLGERSPNVAPTSLSAGFVFDNVRNGPVDLIGGLVPAGVGGLGVPSRYLIQRNLSPAAGSVLAGVSFQGAGSFAPEVRALTINGGGADAIATVTMLKTANAFGIIATNINSAVSWYGVPAAQLQANELHLVSVTATNGGATRTRNISQMIAGPAALAVTFKPELGTISPSRPEARRPRMILPLSFNTDYNRYWVVDMQQGSTWRAQIQMTSGYRGNASGNLTLEIPTGLFGLTGWSTAWEPTAGPVIGTFSATGWDGGAGITTPVWAPGNLFWSATATETIPPVGG